MSLPHFRNIPLTVCSPPLRAQGVKIKITEDVTGCKEQSRHSTLFCSLQFIRCDLLQYTRTEKCNLFVKYQDV